jgi:hypothetical protein
MRKSSLPFVLLATALLVPATGQAKPAWVKKAQELGFKDVQNCQTCHTAKPPALVEMGKWLVDEKGKRKASAIDLAWLKDYKKP